MVVHWELRYSKLLLLLLLLLLLFELPIILPVCFRGTAPGLSAAHLQESCSCKALQPLLLLLLLQQFLQAGCSSSSCW
jgi:hypothetical protein